jgi:hypothetical protein
MARRPAQGSPGAATVARPVEINGRLGLRTLMDTGIAPKRRRRPRMAPRGRLVRRKGAEDLLAAAAGSEFAGRPAGSMSVAPEQYS